MRSGSPSTRTANIYKNVEAGELFNWCDLGVNLYCGPEITRINDMTISGGFTREERLSSPATSTTAPVLQHQ